MTQSPGAQLVRSIGSSYPPEFYRSPQLKLDLSGSGASRRSFLEQVAGMGATAMLGESAITTSSTWDMSWIESVRKAKHRAVFDAPMPGSVLDLATRYYRNIETVYGASSGRACAVINLRTRSVSMGFADAMWQKYPIGEDTKVMDPETSTPARRNVDMRVPADKAAQGYGSLEDLLARGSIFLVCDFALEHLANRLATALSAKADNVHADLRANLIRGAVLVPSGIFGAIEAQNAGCAFFPG